MPAGKSSTAVPTKASEEAVSVPPTQGEATTQTPTHSKAEVETLEKEIKEQGDKIRQLKSSGAEKVSYILSIAMHPIHLTYVYALGYEISSTHCDYGCHIGTHGIAVTNPLICPRYCTSYCLCKLKLIV